MDVHPSSGFNPPDRLVRIPSPLTRCYEIKIDTDGDAVADIAYRIRSLRSRAGAEATLRRVEGAQAAGTDDGGQIIVEGAPVSLIWRHA